MRLLEHTITTVQSLYLEQTVETIMCITVLCKFPSCAITGVFIKDDKELYIQSLVVQLLQTAHCMIFHFQ